MKFSIIVGLYNQARTLPMLLESLNAQTSKDFEVHFCDDGSTDATEFTIRKASNGGQINFPFKYHRQEHKGMRLARNINQGIRAARGEYCLFVMGDSFLEQDYLEVLGQYVDPYRIVCGIRVQVAQNENGRLEGVDIDWRSKKNMIPQFPSVIMGHPWLCLTGNGLTVPTEALRKYGGWCEELEGYGGDDTELVGRLFHKGYVCWSVPDLRLYHHWHIAQDGPPENAKKVHEMIKAYGS